MRNKFFYVLAGLSIFSGIVMAQDPGDECGDPILAVEGENFASGSVQYFRYTAQVDGHILVSSEPDSLGNEADTYVRVFSSCDLENDMLGENDDYTTNSKLSSLVIYVSLGDTIIFEWEDLNFGSGYVWTLFEGEGTPDLPDISIADAVLDADGQVLTVKISNAGAIAVGSLFYVDLWINNDNWPIHCGEPYGDLYQSIGDSLQTDSSSFAEFDLSVLGPGSYEFYISVDNDCLVMETNEENNTSGPINFVQYPWVENISATGLFRSAELQWDPLGEEDALALSNPNAFVKITEPAREAVRSAHRPQDRFRMLPETVRQIHENSLGTTGTREQGESCDDPLSAMSGENGSSGEDQWFTFTTTMNGYLVVSSQNETGDALWDTNLLIYADCDSGSVAVSANDDCCEYYGPSTVEIPISEGETYKIFWSNLWDPGPFDWTITEIPSDQLPELNIVAVEVNNITRTISFSVYNSSMNTPINDIWVDIWIDPIDFSFDCYPNTDYGDLSYFVDVLEPSSSVMVFANLSSLEPGDHEIYLGVDLDCIQMESDETNNSVGPYTISIAPFPEVNVIEYLLYRNGEDIPFATTNETTALDTGLIDGQEYCYTVKASVETEDNVDPSQLTPPVDSVCVISDGIFANLCLPNGFAGETVVEFVEEDTVQSLVLSWSPVGLVGSDVDTSHVPPVNFSSGSLTNEGVTDSSAILARSMSSGWLSFDLSNLVPGLVPVYTELSVEVIDTYKPVWSVTPMHTDPLTDTLETVYLDITEEAGTPEAYGNFIETDEFSPGIYTYILNQSVDTTLANLGSDEVLRMGVHCLDMSDFYYLKIEGWAGENPPKLIVHYAPDMVVEFEATLSAPLVSGHLLDPSYKRAVLQDGEIGFFRSNLSAIPDSVQAPGGERDEMCENLVENPTNFSRGELEWGSSVLYPHVQDGVYSLSSLDFIDWVYMTDNSTTADTARLVISLTDEYGSVSQILMDDSITSDGYSAYRDLEGLQYEAQGSDYLKVSIFPLTLVGDLNGDGENEYAPFVMADNGQNPTGLSGWDSSDDLEFSQDYINWSINLCRNYLGDFSYCGMLEKYSIYSEGELIAQTTDNQYTVSNPILDSLVCYNVLAEYEQGTSAESNGCFLVSSVPNSMGSSEPNTVPKQFSLYQNFPNPFNPLTRIRFYLPERLPVILSIFDIRGRMVNQFSKRDLDPGSHKITWDGTSFGGKRISAGIYIYTLEAGTFSETRKMIYLK